MSVVGSQTITENTVITRMKEIIFAWTSDASGNCSGVSTQRQISGKVKNAVFVPGAGGVAPTDNYKVLAVDKNGNDLLFGLGNGTTLKGNATANFAESDKMGSLVNSTISLSISAAGISKQGTVYLYIQE